MAVSTAFEACMTFAEPLSATVAGDGLPESSPAGTAGPTSRLRASQKISNRCMV